MDFRINVTEVLVKPTGHVDFVCTIEFEETTDVWVQIDSDPGYIRMSLSSIREIAQDDTTWPTRNDKLIELRDRVIEAAADIAAVRRQAVQDQLDAALPTLPYQASFTYP